MCGIAAVFGSSASEGNIYSMVASMAHRGPDGSGVYVEGEIALAHSRLSILDLSEDGYQPMSSESGNLVMVFNGEVFNYRELVQEFLPNERLKSTSDSEVVLRLYEKYGSNAVTFFRGMFALLIWDKEKKELFGARDRLGIKPLYYSKNNSNLLFGSEIKSLLASKLVDKEIDRHSLVQLFQYGHIGQPNSIIEGVKSVPPATYFQVKLNEEIQFNTYWDFNSQDTFEGDFNDACIRFKSEFEEAVELRLISDRPVGVFLSSGLDSVSILAALKNKNYENVNTFTIGFEDKHNKFYREDVKAKEISNFFGYDNETIILNPADIAKDFPSFVFGLDQPSIDGFNSFLISKYTSKSITVALSGLGGDELFMGYPRNLNFLNRLDKKNRLLNSINEKYQSLIQNGVVNSNRYVQYFLNNYAGYNDFNFGFWLHHLLDSYSNNLRKFSFSLKESAEDEMINYLSQSNISTKEARFNRITAFEFRTYTMNQLLRDVDTVSMYNSMEVRVPFLDHKFIEFCLSLPDSFKYNSQSISQKFGTGRTTYSGSGMKYILGKSYESILPPGFLQTPKQGFQLPVYDWALEFCSANSYDFLSNKMLSEYFSSDYLTKKRNDLHRNGKFDNDLFLIFILVLWYDSVL